MWSMRDGGAKATHFPVAPPARTQSSPYGCPAAPALPHPPGHIQHHASSLLCPSGHFHLITFVLLCPLGHLHPITSILPHPWGPGLLLPRGRKFLHGPVSLCVFGPGTMLTVLGKSPTSSRSFLPHRGIVTFCRFSVIWGFFLGLGAGQGSAAGSGMGTKRGIVGCVLSLRTQRALVRTTEDWGVFSQLKELKIWPGNLSEVSGNLFQKLRFRSLRKSIFVFVKEISH